MADPRKPAAVEADDWIDVPGPDAPTGDWAAVPSPKTPYKADAPQALPDPAGSPVSRFVQGLWQNTGGAAINAGKAAVDLGQAIVNPTHQLDSATKQIGQNIVQSHRDQWNKMQEAWKAGSPVEAAGHALAAGLPIVGPAAAHAAERMSDFEPATFDKYGNVITPGRAPDIAGGLGEGAGLLLPSAIAHTPAAASAVGRAVPAAASAVGRAVGIPSFARAAEVFDQVTRAAGHLPIDVTAPGQSALDAQVLAQSGGHLPKVISDFLDRTTAPKQPPLTFSEARNFYSNASRLSMDEANRLTPVMQRAVNDFRAKLDASLTDAATKAGQGDAYRAAMQEWRQAARMRTAAKAVGKHAVKWGTGAIGATELWRLYQDTKKAQGGAILDRQPSRAEILRDLKSRYADGGPSEDKPAKFVPGREAVSRFTRTPITIHDNKANFDQPSTGSFGGSSYDPAIGWYKPNPRIAVEAYGTPDYSDVAKTIHHEDIHALLERAGYKYPNLPLDIWDKLTGENPVAKAADALKRGNRMGSPAIELPAYVGAYRYSELPGFTEEDRQKYLNSLYRTMDPDAASTLRRIVQSYNASQDPPFATHATGGAILDQQPSRAQVLRGLGARAYADGGGADDETWWQKLLRGPKVARPGAQPTVESIAQQKLQSMQPPAAPLPRNYVKDPANVQQINPQPGTALYFQQHPEAPMGDVASSLAATAFSFTPEGQAVQTALNPKSVLEADAPLVGTGIGHGPAERQIEAPPAPHIEAPPRVQVPERLVQPATMQDLNTLTGVQLGSGTHATGEAALARERLVKQTLQRLRDQQFTPQEQDLFQQARQSVPEMDLMTPLEARKVIASPENVNAIQRMLQVIPSSAQLASAAKAGISKLGWYRGSSQALMDVFGEDAPRFAQLLAAMSPQTSVESNLHNALNTWKNWIAEGRPTDPAAIKTIMGKSVQGNKGEKSVLDAWVNNTISALSAQDPTKVTLSGPKVDSFYRNLRDDVFRVTNDAWMANALGIVQDAFSGSPSALQQAGGDPGMTWRYAGASARLRDAGLKAGMLPSQSQETIWSTAMQLYELAKKSGLHPREVLERNMLTPEIIRGAPDFSTLLKDPKYASILERGGYGDKLHAMQPFQFPLTNLPMSGAEQEHLGQIADVLGQTKELRDRESRSKVFQTREPGNYPATGFVHEQLEATPGRVTGHFPGMPDLPYGTRRYYTSAGLGAFEDPRGRDVLQNASGLDALSVRGMIGSFKERGKPWDTNPGRSLPAEVPLQWAWDNDLGRYKPVLSPENMARVEAPAAVHGAMMGQAGVGLPGLVSHPEGQHFVLEMPDKPKLTPEVMQKLQAKYPKLTFAHTGKDIAVLDLENLNLTDIQRKNVAKMAGALGHVNADNVGSYVNYADAWANKPGSGAVTQRMLDYVDKLRPEEQAALDQAVRQPAGDVLAHYAQNVKSRKLPARADLMNMLQIMHEQGLAGVRAGLKSGAFLPALAGAFLLPALTQRQAGDDRQPAGAFARD